MIEDYTFTVETREDGTLAFAMAGQEFDMGNLKRDTMQLLKQVNLVAQGLEAMPDDVKLNLKLTYTDGMTRNTIYGLLL